MKRGAGERSSRRTIMCATAAINTNASIWGGGGDCLGFFVHLFSLVYTLGSSSLLGVDNFCRYVFHLINKVNHTVCGSVIVYN
jgi:hypothetical protein